MSPTAGRHENPELRPRVLCTVRRLLHATMIGC